MIYSAYKLNKQGDNIQPWCIPFPIWSQSIVPCPVLLLLDLHTDFLGGTSGGLVFPSLQEFSTVCCDAVKGFGVVNKAEVDVFLELSCFFDDLRDVGNLISGSSAFSKSILNIWKFPVHILLEPDLENFEHYFASMWDECSCAVVWTIFGITFLWDWNETDLFQSCGHCWIFQFAGILSADLLASSLRNVFSNPFPIFIFIYFYLFLLVEGWLLYNIAVVFAIHWHESAMDLHVFPILIPPPTSLPIPSLWVFPVHQPWALVPCIQPGLVICFTLDSILVSMLFSQIIPPSPSPTESKSLFCTSVSLFLFCI